MIEKDKFTSGPWNSHIRYMTDALGNTRRKCFIEKDGIALAQFANFGDVDEANAMLCAVAPEMYQLLGKVMDYFENSGIYGYGVDESVRSDLLREIKKVMRKALEGN